MAALDLVLILLILGGQQGTHVHPRTTSLIDKQANSKMTLNLTPKDLKIMACANIDYNFRDVILGRCIVACRTNHKQLIKYLFEKESINWKVLITGLNQN